MFASRKMWKTKKELLKNIITLSNILIFAYKFYNVIVKIVTIKVTLQTIEMEFNALANPTSHFNSPVYAGADDGNGLNKTIIRACRTSKGNGKM